VIDGLRGEFPGATRWVGHLEKPAISRESVGWALLSALGAAFIVEAIVGVALMPIYPAVFPPTEPHPEWLTPSLIANVAGGFVAAAVALRAGGVAALAAYLAYELLILLAALPGRTIFCERSGGLAPDLSPAAVCWSPQFLLTERWPMWLAIALGVVAARLLRVRAGEGNWLLRGAGAFAIVASALGSMLGLLVTVTGTGGNPNTLVLSVLFLVIQIAAGIAAGLLLARLPLAGAVLVALLIVGPTFAFALPLALRNGFPNEPVEFTFARWLGVLIPVLGAAALLASRAYVRSTGASSTSVAS
jgi:hypothetical protein